MDALIETLNASLNQWDPESVAEVRQRLSGIIGLADQDVLGLAAKIRAVVIVSHLDADPPRALAIYVPLTTQNRNSLYEVEMPRLGFLHAISVANVQGIASIPTIRLERRLGTLAQLRWNRLRPVRARNRRPVSSTSKRELHCESATLLDSSRTCPEALRATESNIRTALRRTRPGAVRARQILRNIRP